MKYIIDTDVLNRTDLNLSEFGLLLYYVGGNEELPSVPTVRNLWHKGYLIKTGDETYVFDIGKFEELQAILSEGSNNKPTNKRAEELAPKMREIYPSGYKEIYIGGIKKKYSWRDSDRIIANRMKIFFKRYGTSFTDAQILDATKRYVTSNGEDYTYMKLLKYFIFKDNKAQDGGGESYTDESSELMAYIENPDKNESMSNDTGELI